MTNWKQGELPPIGTKCEAKWPTSKEIGTCQEWQSGRFKGGYDSKVWFGTDSHIDVVVFSHEIIFRPFKTPAEVKMESVVNLALDSLGYDPDDFKGCINGEPQSDLVDDLVKLFNVGLLSDPEKRVKGIKGVSFEQFTNALYSIQAYHEYLEAYNKWVSDGIIRMVDDDA